MQFADGKKKHIKKPHMLHIIPGFAKVLKLPELFKLCDNTTTDRNIQTNTKQQIIRKWKKNNKWL